MEAQETAEVSLNVVSDVLTSGDGHSASFDLSREGHSIKHISTFCTLLQLYTDPSLPGLNPNG